mmetsp:Transcript_20387/g.22724  ORF Transcript_20387/g.22724 Transcript_20387/m.22724 type:complete len:205 (+) Transcript_20387:839-1453(+)
MMPFHSDRVAILTSTLLLLLLRTLMRLLMRRLLSHCVSRLESSTEVESSSEVELDDILFLSFNFGNRYLLSFGCACRYLCNAGNSFGFSNLNLSTYNSGFSFWCLCLYSLYLSSVSQSQSLSSQLHNSILFTLQSLLIPSLLFDLTPHDISSGIVFVPLSTPQDTSSRTVLVELLHTPEFLLSDSYDSYTLFSLDDSSEDTYAT